MDRLTLPRVAFPGFAVAATPASPYERGADSAGVVHAVRKSLNGMAAICGAGRIATQLVGRFDPASPDACRACVAAVNAGR
jgi:hypothetical protein